MRQSSSIQSSKQAGFGPPCETSAYSSLYLPGHDMNMAGLIARHFIIEGFLGWATSSELGAGDISRQNIQGLWMAGRLRP